MREFDGYRVFGQILDSHAMVGPKRPANRWNERRPLGNTLTSVARFCCAQYRTDRGRAWSVAGPARRVPCPSHGRSCHAALRQPDETSLRSHAARPLWCVIAVPLSNLSVGRSTPAHSQTAPIVFVQSADGVLTKCAWGAAEVAYTNSAMILSRTQPVEFGQTGEVAWLLILPRSTVPYHDVGRRILINMMRTQFSRTLSFPRAAASQFQISCGRSLSPSNCMTHKSRTGS